MPTLGFTDNDGIDVGNKYVTKDYVMSTYPNYVGNFINVPGLWTWGNNSDGALGINQGTTVNATTPTLIPSLTGGALSWVQVSGSISGNSAVGGIKTDGSLWLWGSNNSNRLAATGVATNTIRTSPQTPAGGGTNWAQVSVGGSAAGGIKTDGTLWTWGANSNGELGINSAANQSRTSPVQVGTATTWKQLSYGSLSAGAIKTDGTLWTWGINTIGEIGTGDLANKLQPTTIAGAGTNWKQLSMSSQGGAAVKTDGSLWIWGSGSNGRIGDGQTAFNRTSPATPTGGNTSWKYVCSAESTSIFAIKTDGTLWGWGANSNGVLGDGTTVAKTSPVTVVGGGTSWKTVLGTQGSAIALKTDGTLWTWGRNNTFTLGSGAATNVSRSSPGTISGHGTYWKTIGTASNTMYAIKEADDW